MKKNLCKKARKKKNSSPAEDSDSDDESKAEDKNLMHSKKAISVRQSSRLASSRCDSSRAKDPRSFPENKNCALSGPSGHESPESTLGTGKLTRKEQELSQRDENNRDRFGASGHKPSKPSLKQSRGDRLRKVQSSEHLISSSTQASDDIMDGTCFSTALLPDVSALQTSVYVSPPTPIAANEMNLASQVSEIDNLVVPSKELPHIQGNKLIILVPLCNILTCAFDGCTRQYTGKDTSTARSVIRHLARDHAKTVEIDYRCRFCYFTAPEVEAYPIKSVQRHVITVHQKFVTQSSEVLTIQCEFPGCSRSFRNKLGLSNHLRTHKRKPPTIKNMARKKYPPKTRDEKVNFESWNDPDANSTGKVFTDGSPKNTPPTTPSTTSSSHHLDTCMSSPQIQPSLCHDLKYMSSPQSPQIQPSFITRVSSIFSGLLFASSPSKYESSEKSSIVELYTNKRETKTTPNDDSPISTKTINLVEKTLDPEDLRLNPVAIDLKKLADPNGWLDDSIIMNYLSEHLILLDEKAIIIDPLLWEKENFICAAKKYVRPKFREDWSRAVLPIHQGGNHWVLAIAEKQGDVLFYNTMGGVLFPEIEAKLKKIVQEIRSNASTAVIKRVDPKTFYIQLDGNSCGPAVCLLAERIVHAAMTGASPNLKFTLYETKEWRKNALNYFKNKFPDIVVATPSQDPKPAAKPKNFPKKEEPKPTRKHKIVPKPIPKTSPHHQYSHSASSPIQKNQTKEKQLTLPVKVYQSIKSELNKQQTWEEFSKTCFKLTAMIKCLKEGKDPFIETNLHLQRMKSKKSEQRQVKEPVSDVKPPTTSNIMKLYNCHKKKAIEKIVGKSSIQCEIDPKTVTEFFKCQYKATGCKRFTEFENVVDKSARINENFVRPITRHEVRRIIQRSKNTAPGEDRISYKELSDIDPSFTILTKIYNRCLQEKRIPTHWKRSYTILIFKKNDAQQMENWRPIALTNTIYKIYTGIWAQRLQSFPELISPEQKGFGRLDGTGEHTALLRSAINQATNQKKEMAAAWLDLSNAFGSLPHDAIIQALQGFGFPDDFISIIRDLYTDTTTTVRTKDVITESIPIGSGVKQGDPLSPTLFNLAIEPILRSIKSRFQDSLKLHDVPIGPLAFADDLAIVGKTAEELQCMLDTIDRLSKNRGLRFNAKKCASLHISKGQIQPTKFKICGEEISKLKDQDHYDYLGTELGKNVRSNLKAKAEQLLADLKRIEESKLAPWQKIDAIKIFIITKMTYRIRHGDPYIGDLKELDRAIKFAVRTCCKLPHLGTPEHYIYGSIEKGGLGILSLEEEYHLQSLNSISRLLYSQDPKIRTYFDRFIKSSAKKWLGKVQLDVTKEEICDLLNGKTTDGYSPFVANHESHTLISRIRRSTRALGHKKRGFMKCQFYYDNDELLLAIRTVDGKDYTLSPRQKFKFYASLRKLLVENHIYILNSSKYKLAGSSIKSIQLSSESSNFNKKGHGITFSGYNFIHKARLGLHVLNGSNRLTKERKQKTPEEMKCRRCGYDRETLNHVLSHCFVAHGSEITKRHNDIVDQLVKRIPKNLSTEVILNKSTGSGNRTRPDILKIDHMEKRACIIDVTCPFEKDEHSLNLAAKRKIQKYSNEASILRSQGYRVFLGGFVVGTLGAWHPRNNAALKALGIEKKWHNHLSNNIVGLTIEHSKTIFWRHIFAKQYTIPKNIYFENMQ